MRRKNAQHRRKREKREKETRPELRGRRKAQEERAAKGCKIICSPARIVVGARKSHDFGKQEIYMNANNLIPYNQIILLCQV